MLGAQLTPKGVRYSVWAPRCKTVEVEIAPAGELALETPRILKASAKGDGYFRALDASGRAGDRYRFRLDGQGPFPDPASLAQAEGVHGASVVCDPSLYQWQDAQWQRPAFRDLVIYELHIGTFSPGGTFLSALEYLPRLAALGVNAIELMPIADFPGNRNWGYDGVLIYAPARAYGTPDDLRILVDTAHGLGLAVILDVVYNHLGPDGNYLSRYSAHFFNPAHQTPWGAALNFDGQCAGEVREFFARNPVYWMEQFHIDGVRLDATHAVVDESQPHIFLQITRAVHALGGYVIAEDCRHEPRLVLPPDSGGYGFDAVWADDFHHILRVALTGEREGYFAPFRGSPEELAEVLRKGWLCKKTGAGAFLPPTRFIHCISNHDQVGNRAFGERLSASVSAQAYRAASALLLLSPFTPLLFMGQEWAASTPFLYFTHHHAELGPLVTQGRRREFAAFPGFRDEAALSQIPDPQDEATFERSHLNWEESEAPEHAGVLALYRECLRLRREKSALLRPSVLGEWEVAMLRCGVVGLRFGAENEKLLLLCDLTGGHAGSLGGEPIARLALEERWELMFSSNEARFGVPGAQEFDGAAQRCVFDTPGVVLLTCPGMDGHAA